jgi:hypothetical protein
VFNSGRNFGLFGLGMYGVCNGVRKFGLSVLTGVGVFSNGRNFGLFGPGMCSV